ncbi:hypothetical protein ABWH93_16015 [Seohaeicola saemankumensis]|jgi:hypothetical protein|uniref:hypothetical protein n=1 Tax=Seohaeicola TaxID=481178 RepID=UPI0035CF1C87
MISTLTQDEVDVVSGGSRFAPGLSQPRASASSFGGFENAGDPTQARTFTLALARFLRSNPTVTSMDFGLDNLP